MADSIQKLSGSTGGRGIKVAATATPGTTIHVAHATAIDLITLFAVNNDADNEDRLVTLEWGGTSLEDTIPTWVPNKSGLYLLTDRLPLTNLTVAAFADETNDVSIHGFVTRIGA